MVKTTNVGQVIELLSAMEEIRGQKMNKQAAKALFDLRKKATETSNFFQEQQKEIIDRLGLKIAPDGRIDFQNNEFLFKSYQNEIEELRHVEVNLDFEEVDLSEEDIKVSEAFIGATDGIIKLF